MIQIQPATKTRPICSMNNAQMLYGIFLLKRGYASERTLLALGYEWKQLVLPGFNKVMGI